MVTSRIINYSILRSPFSSVISHAFINFYLIICCNSVISVCTMAVLRLLLLSITCYAVIIGGEFMNRLIYNEHYDIVRV